MLQGVNIGHTTLSAPYLCLYSSRYGRCQVYIFVHSLTRQYKLLQLFFKYKMQNVDYTELKSKQNETTFQKVQDFFCRLVVVAVLFCFFFCFGLIFFIIFLLLFCCVFNVCFFLLLSLVLVVCCCFFSAYLLACVGCFLLFCFDFLLLYFHLFQCTCTNQTVRLFFMFWLSRQKRTSALKCLRTVYFSIYI